MIVLDMTSPYMALSKPKQVHERAPRIPRLLSPGNTNRNQPLSQYSFPEDISSTTEEEFALYRGAVNGILSKGT